MSPPLLAVENLSIAVDTPYRNEEIVLVNDVSFTVAGGERLAVVGESGCGKTVTARALLQLDSNLRITGSVRLRDRELIGLSARELAEVRGREIGMIFQDPLTALNPTMRIGEQVAEPLVAQGTRKRVAHARAKDLLHDLGVPDVERRMAAYPHEFSGGMRQRVVMAIALISDPTLLIADEPTTALDVMVQAQVLRLLASVVRQRDLALMIITHDMGIVAAIADRVLVMYAGNVIEQAGVQDLLEKPLHPYTRGLLGAVPRIDGPPQHRLASLAGLPPAPVDRPAGCPFHPRCNLAIDECRTTAPPLLDVAISRRVACPITTRPKERIDG